MWKNGGNARTLCAEIDVVSTPTFASLADRAEMMALWLEAFDDEPAEVEAFFERFFSPKTALVMRDGDRVVSMLFLLPVTAVSPCEKRAVGYVYGGATCKHDRGKGHYRNLLEYARFVGKSQGMSALFLHPANKKLDESYRRMGFTVPLYACESFAPKSFVHREATALSAQQYRQWRCRLLKAQQAAYLDWDCAVLSHCLTWCRAYAFGETACALISDDWSTVYEYLSAETDAVNIPLQAPNTPIHCRTFGNESVVGLLCPLSDAAWEAPFYMGYGME